MTMPKAVDCKCTNVFGWGAFTYNRSVGVEMIRCEAARCFNGTNGDGFNADASNNGDYLAKQYTDTLIECWSHDNADDGWSCHRRSETTIIGGLYEYNGKAGITPSYGNHCTCHDVYSRYNHCGFYYTGEVEQAEAGKYGQLLCYNCVAEKNNADGNKAGFAVSGAGNSLRLVNCKSIGNINGYRTVNASNEIILIDCGYRGSGNITYGPGTITIQNTTLVQ